jgi:hypothetical protein
MNWDVAIYRLMSVVLITALGCRGGDAARSRGYSGIEYLQYRHVELVLEGDANIYNIHARITLEYPKGSKDVRHENLVCHLRPLEDDQLAYMCPNSD